MNGIHTMLLIDPTTHKVAATLREENDQKTVTIHDVWLAQGLASNGIAVPRKIEGKSYIYPTDEPQLFAKAFTEEYFRHGLQQKGFYWIKEEDYEGPNQEVQKALDCVLKALGKPPRKIVVD